MDLLPKLALAGVIAAVLVAGWVHWRERERRRVLRGLLDAADALEGQLRKARGRIGAAPGGQPDPVHAAMQEMLRQRLWLQQHGQRASLRQLARVRDSIDLGRQRLDRQLARGQPGADRR